LPSCARNDEHRESSIKHRNTYFNSKKLLNLWANPADFVACAFSAKFYEIFFDNAFCGPIIAQLDLLSGVINDG